MKGYMYKEWKQNRVYFMLTAIVAIASVFLPILIVMTIEKNISKNVFFTFVSEGIWCQLVCIFLGFIAVLIFQDNTLRDDDRKSWGYFVASNPKGIKGYVFTKYMIVALLGIFFFLVSAGGYYIFNLLAKNIGDIKMPNMTETCAMLLFEQLLIQAVDIPFSIRFGVKKGNMIKTIIFMTFFVILIVMFLINPEGIADFVLWIEMDRGLPDLGKWFLPVISLALYIISGVISCKLYLKGVHQSYR